MAEQFNPTLPRRAGVPVRDLLTNIGFREDWDAITDELPGYSFDFGNFVLRGVAGMTRHFEPTFYFDGIWQTERALQAVAFEMPLTVQSREQGIAWLAKGIPQELVPLLASTWLEEGRALRGHLPWEQSARRYDARPRCVIDRDWMRLAIRRLRTTSDNAGPEDLCRIAFDGTVLLFRSAVEPVAVPALEGSPWVDSVEVRLRDFNGLPLRLQGERVEVSVWDGALRVGNRAFKVLRAESVTPGGSVGATREAHGTFHLGGESGR